MIENEINNTQANCNHIACTIGYNYQDNSKLEFYDGIIYGKNGLMNYWLIIILYKIFLI